MLRIRLTLAYLGTAFAGWQKQPLERTVQGELEQALAELYRQEVRTVGAGRTDAGVHAKGQVVHFDPPFPIPPRGLLAALNNLLPNDMRVLDAKETNARFHARRGAVGKRYCYRLAWGGVLPPWDALRRWWVPKKPDVYLLAEVLTRCQGTHDFGRFALAGHMGTGKRGTQRTLFLTRLTVQPQGAKVVFEGDGFLRGMVRRLVGGALQVAWGRQDLSWFLALLGGDARQPVPPTAPAHGLTLERVFYRRPQRWQGLSAW